MELNPHNVTDQANLNQLRVLPHLTLYDYYPDL